MMLLEEAKIPCSGAQYIYDRFPSNTRTEEQEEKRKQTLVVVSGALDSTTKTYHAEDEGLSQLKRDAERERMVLDIKGKLQVTPEESRKLNLPLECLNRTPSGETVAKPEL